MKRLPPSLAVLAVVLSAMTFASCASGERDGPRRSMDAIAQDELTGLMVASAYHAIQRLRPRWLQGRGATSFRSQVDLPVVFVDEVRFGAIQTLQDIQVTDVQSMHFINARDATTRFGTGYPAGIIDIRTRR